MKNLAAITCLLFLFTACNVEPREIRYGVDICNHCKMKLMDPQYGAEVLTQKGKIFIFDDVNCLMEFLDSDEISMKDIKQILVVDYNNPGILTDATMSFYLKSDSFKTPMASNIAAFEDYDKLKEYKARYGGIYLAWGELVTQFK